MKTFIRPAVLSDSSECAHLHVDTWRTTYQGIMSEKYLASLLYSDFEAGWMKTLSSNDIGETHARWVAVNQSGKLVGFIGGGKQRSNIKNHESELYGIYILKEFEGKGIAKKLIHVFVDWLIEKKFKTMILWVLKDNTKARGFYSSIGGQLLEEYKEDRIFGGQALIEVAYGWSNLTQLKNNLNNGLKR